MVNKTAQCLKITEKVAFNIANILSEPKSIKNAKKMVKNLRSTSVTRQVTLIRQKLVENA